MLGAVILCSLSEGLRFLDLPLSSGQVGSLRMILVGLILVGLCLYRPEGLVGNQAEMRLRS